VQDPDASVRAEACATLRDLGAAAKEAVPALLAALKKQEDLPSGPELSALEGIDPQAAARLREEAEAKKDVVIAGKPLSAWLEQLKDADAAKRLEALRAFAGVPRKRPLPAVLAFVEALRDKDEKVREYAGQTLAYGFGPDIDLALPALAGLLKEKDEALRLEVLGVLRRLESLAKPAAPALAELVKDPSPKVSRAAVEALENIGPGAQAAVPALIDRLTHEDEAVRQASARALERIEPDPERAVPALCTVLKNGGPGSAEAAFVLGRMGPKAKKAVPALAEALKSQDDKVVARAAEALAAMGADAKPAVPALVEVAKGAGGASEKARQAVRRIDPAAAAKAGLR
jgi:HEAT repeat protein